MCKDIDNYSCTNQAFCVIQIAHKLTFCFYSPGPSSMSPTGGAAWREAKLQRGSLISQDMSDLSPLGPGPYSIYGYPESQHGEHYIRRYGSYGEYPMGNGINDTYNGGGVTRKGIIAQLCPCLSKPAVSEGEPIVHFVIITKKVFVVSICLQRFMGNVLCDVFFLCCKHSYISQI